MDYAYDIRRKSCLASNRLAYSLWFAFDALLAGAKMLGGFAQCIISLSRWGCLFGTMFEPSMLVCQGCLPISRGAAGQ